MISSKNLKNNAAAVVPYFVVDSCGSLIIFKLISSKRKVVNRSDFISEVDVEIASQDKWKFITIDNPIEIHNFNCIVQFKRDTVPKGGVAIYQNNNNVTNNMTPNIE